jgi:transcriptional regulator with XRE-family HTH domain
MARAVGQGVPWRERRAVAALLRRARTEAGLRQQDLAERLGVPQSFVARVEAGDRQLTLLETRAACAALGLPLAAFVGRLEEALAGEGDAADGVGHAGDAAGVGG